MEIPVLTEIAVGAAGNIYRYTGNQGDPNHWVQISSALTAISDGIKTSV